jgi:hypothetical protein
LGMIKQREEGGPILDKTKAGAAAFTPHSSPTNNAAAAVPPMLPPHTQSGECILVAADTTTGELIGCVHGEWLFGEAGTIPGSWHSFVGNRFGLRYDGRACPCCGSTRAPPSHLSGGYPSADFQPLCPDCTGSNLSAPYQASQPLLLCTASACSPFLLGTADEGQARRW